MAEKTIKGRLQDAGDPSLASDDGLIFSTVAKLVEGFKRTPFQKERKTRRGWT